MRDYLNSVVGGFLACPLFLMTAVVFVLAAIVAPIFGLLGQVKIVSNDDSHEVNIGIIGMIKKIIKDIRGN